MPEATLKSALTQYAINDGSGEAAALIKETHPWFDVESDNHGTITVTHTHNKMSRVVHSIKLDKVVYVTGNNNLVVTTAARFNELYHTVVRNA